MEDKEITDLVTDCGALVKPHPMGGAGGGGGGVMICNLRTGNVWSIPDTDVLDVPASAALSIAMD